MPQFYGYGNSLVSSEQFMQASDKELRKLASGAPPAALVSARFATRLSGLNFAAAPQPTAIGIGRPLSAELAYVYTGSLSKPGWHRPDMLLASSVKKLPVYDAAPRAMQTVLQGVSEKFGFSSLPANIPGTPLIYHTPSLTDRGITVTIEMIFDRFPSETFDQIGNMLSTAAGIPVFAPAGAYLMAGSIIVKLFAKVAEAIIDGRPAFAENLNINVDRPLYQDTAPGFLVLCPPGTLAGAIGRKEFIPAGDRGLISAGGGAPYNGPDPYVIVSLDGSDRTDYASFTPTMAAASVLSRFLHIGDGQPTATGLMIEALKAYNDIHYRSLADSAKKRLADLDPNSEEAKNLKKLLEAYIKNIGNDDLRPAA